MKKIVAFPGGMCGFMPSVFMLLLVACLNSPEQVVKPDEHPVQVDPVRSANDTPDNQTTEDNQAVEDSKVEDSKSIASIAAADEDETDNQDTSTPADEKIKPGEKRRPPPLPATHEIYRQIERWISNPYFIVTLNGKPRLHLKDLNIDGIPEILVPCVESDQEVDSDSFSDFSSLFSKERQPHPFFLYVFQMGEEGLFPAGRIYLGPRYVFGGMARIQIERNGSFPNVLVVKFQTQEGEEQEWLIFDGLSILPVSRLSLRETFSSKLLIEDIDADGNIDIVVQEKAAEEGIGLETFLTWYRWNGSRFVEYATANIIRSLKSYLARVKEYLLKGDWENLVDFSFSPEDLKRYRGNTTAAEIILEVFGLSDMYGSDRGRAEEILANIKEIVFPDFLENPFLARDERGSFFRLTFRIVDTDGISVISDMPLYMSKNPFQKRRFFIPIMGKQWN